MAFNVGSYIKESAKTVQQRIVDNAVDASYNSLSAESRSIAFNVAGALLGIGSSVDSIDTFTRSITDSIISETLSEFKELASSSNVSAARSVSTDQNVNAFLSTVNPSTKLTSSSSDLEVIVVV